MLALLALVTLNLVFVVVLSGCGFVSADYGEIMLPGLLALNAVFLVAPESYTTFRTVLSQLLARFEPSGFTTSAMCAYTGVANPSAFW